MSAASVSAWFPLTHLLKDFKDECLLFISFLELHISSIEG